MQNPKTTWAGVAVIVAAIANFAAQFFQGHSIDVNLISSVVGGITAGLALIHAADGTP